jgi:penicillin-binding protein 1A
VYADKTLGYSQDERFDIPDGFNPCAAETYDDDGSQAEELGGGLDDLFN